MTPSTSLTLEGFLRGLHASSVGLISTIVVITVTWLFVRCLIGKNEAVWQTKEIATSKIWCNRIAGGMILLTLISFALSAANYAVNMIPRAGLDGSSIYQQMDANKGTETKLYQQNKEN